MANLEKAPIKIYGNDSLTSRVAAFQKKADEHSTKQKHNPFSHSGAMAGFGLPKWDKSDPRYGKPAEGSKTEKRGLAAGAHIGNEVIFLCEMIHTYGVPDEDGTVSITFGELFQALAATTSLLLFQSFGVSSLVQQVPPLYLLSYSLFTFNWRLEIFPFPTTESVTMATLACAKSVTMVTGESTIFQAPVQNEPSIAVTTRIYTTISNKVVGILLRARKQGLVQFEGEMLYQRRDDDVIITLVKPISELIPNRALPKQKHDSEESAIPAEDY